MAKVTYDDLVGLAQAELELCNRDTIGPEVDYILDAARVNADDTMREGTDQTWESLVYWSWCKILKII